MSLRAKMLGSLAVALCFTVLATLYTREAADLSLGSMERPGPGLFPVVVGILFIVMSLVAGGEALLAGRRSATEPAAEPAVEQTAPEHDAREDLNYRRLAPFVAVLVLHVSLIEMLGFIISTSLSLAAISFMLGARSWAAAVRSGVFAIAFTFLMFFFFSSFLDIRLPVGLYAPLL